MKLTQRNYYGPKASREYMSVSQFKNFLSCEAAAMAELNGTYTPERGRALLLGSYVDEMLTGTERSQEKFLAENYSELFKKNGDPYADVAQAINAVEVVGTQPLGQKYIINSKHQVIMTGEIAGVPFKGKFDGYKPGQFLADLKYLKSLRAPNLFDNVIRFWRYDLQMAVYQELIFQNTGERLPCYIVAVTKENPPHFTACEIDQFTLDQNLEEVKRLAPHFQKIKNGEIEPERCEHYDCSFCTSTRILTEPVPYEQITMSAQDLKIMRGELT